MEPRLPVTGRRVCAHRGLTPPTKPVLRGEKTSSNGQLKNAVLRHRMEGREAMWSCAERWEHPDGTAATGAGA